MSSLLLVHKSILMSWSSFDVILMFPSLADVLRPWEGANGFVGMCLCLLPLGRRGVGMAPWENVSGSFSYKKIFGFQVY